MSLLILNAEDVAKSISMSEAIGAMHIAFSSLAANDTECPSRTVMPIQKKDAFFLTMPAYIKTNGSLGVKISSIFPSNNSVGLPLIHAYVILINEENGQPKAIIDGRSVTAIRTGAVSGLATKLLAKADASSLAIIGAGVQAEMQIKAICSVRKINEIFIYSRDRQKADLLSEKIKLQKNISRNIHVVNSVQSAVLNADIVCTATSTDSSSPIVLARDIAHGKHINAIGGRTPSACEFDPQLLRSSIIVVDEKKAALQEAGEIIEGLRREYFKESNLLELGNVINQGPNFYEEIISNGNTTIFKSVGLAIQDMAAAEVVYKNAIKSGLGYEITM